MATMTYKPSTKKPKKGDEQTGLVLRMDGTTERFTWKLGQSGTLDIWQRLIPDVTFTGMTLDAMGVYMLSDDEGKLRSDWASRINMVATILFGNNFGVALCNPDVQISGDAIVVGIGAWGDGHVIGLSEGSLKLIEMLANEVRGKQFPKGHTPEREEPEDHGTFIIDI